MKSIILLIEKENVLIEPIILPIEWSSSCKTLCGDPYKLNLGLKQVLESCCSPSKINNKISLKMVLQNRPEKFI